MKLDSIFYNLFKERGKNVLIENLTIGLGYSAVTTDDGGIGIAYTYFDPKKTCSVVKDYYDYEGKPALELLEKIKSKILIERTMALALINALNYKNALKMPDDKDNNIMFEILDIKKGRNVSMVGFFGPLITYFRKNNIDLDILDNTKKIGNKEDFYKKLKTGTDVLILTSTSLLNSTTEEIHENTGEKVKTVLLGPSTPMVKEAFEHLPVSILAGTVPLDKDKVLKAIRHGTGTPNIQRYSKKVYLVL